MKVRDPGMEQTPYPRWKPSAPRRKRGILYARERGREKRAVEGGGMSLIMGAGFPGQQPPFCWGGEYEYD